jgi:hypothetical protein
MRVMRLPKVASRLRELAINLGYDELDELADEIGRQSPRQRAPITSASMTDALRALKAAEPDLSQVEIRRRFNLNPGRVSEALRGKTA